MKKLIAFFLLSVLPNLCLAEWIGMHDVRRYVTDAEKNVFPYNRVVRINSETGWSTGTFISPNVILTCRHCVESNGLKNSVDFYTTDGAKHSGIVWFFKDDNHINSDYALVLVKDSQYSDGQNFDVLSEAVADNAAVRIGYDSLKVMSDEEISIAHKVFVEVLRKYKKVTAANSDDAIDEVEFILANNWQCKSGSDTNCVQCGQDGCLFNDGERLKVQDSCGVTSLQLVDGGGEMLLTKCALSPGGSGGPLLSNDKSHLLGIVAGTMGFELGAKTTPNTVAVKPEEYAKSAQTLVNMVDNGLIEY